MKDLLGHLCEVAIGFETISYVKFQSYPTKTAQLWKSLAPIIFEYISRCLFSKQIAPNQNESTCVGLVATLKQPHQFNKLYPQNPLCELKSLHYY